MIENADRSKFRFTPEEYFENKEVCVTGEIKDFKGKPEMHVTEPSQIKQAEAAKVH